MGAHIHEQPAVVILMVGHQSVIGDRAAQAEHDASNVLIERKLRQWPGLKQPEAKLHQNCQCWQQVCVYIPCQKVIIVTADKELKPFANLSMTFNFFVNPN